MKNVNYAQNTVNQVLNSIPEAGYVLRTHDVVTTNTNRLSLQEAAHSVSTSSDELLAAMEYRIRRAARAHR